MESRSEQMGKIATTADVLEAQQKEQKVRDSMDKSKTNITIFRWILWNELKWIVMVLCVSLFCRLKLYVCYFSWVMMHFDAKQKKKTLSKIQIDQNSSKYFTQTPSNQFQSSETKSICHLRRHNVNIKWFICFFPSYFAVVRLSFQTFHAELHQYKYHIELFNQLTQKLIAVYPSDDTSRIKRMTESVNVR